MAPVTPPPYLHELRSLAALHPDPVGVALVAWEHLHALLAYVVTLEVVVATLEAEAERPGAAHGERG